MMKGKICRRTRAGRHPDIISRVLKAISYGLICHLLVWFSLATCYGEDCPREMIPSIIWKSFAFGLLAMAVTVYIALAWERRKRPEDRTVE